MLVEMNAADTESGAKTYTEYIDSPTASSRIIRCGFKPKYVCLIYYAPSLTYRTLTEIYDEDVSTTKVHTINQSGSSIIDKGNGLFYNVTEDGFICTSSITSYRYLNIVCIG